MEQEDRICVRRTVFSSPALWDPRVEWDREIEAGVCLLCGQCASLMLECTAVHRHAFCMGCHRPNRVCNSFATRSARYLEKPCGALLRVAKTIMDVNCTHAKCDRQCVGQTYAVPGPYTGLKPHWYCHSSKMAPNSTMVTTLGTLQRFSKGYVFAMTCAFALLEVDGTRYELRKSSRPPYILAPRAAHMIKISRVEELPLRLRDFSDTWKSCRVARVAPPLAADEYVVWDGQLVAGPTTKQIELAARPTGLRFCQEKRACKTDVDISVFTYRHRHQFCVRMSPVGTVFYRCLFAECTHATVAELMRWCWPAADVTSETNVARTAKNKQGTLLCDYVRAMLAPVPEYVQLTLQSALRTLDASRQHWINAWDMTLARLRALCTRQKSRVIYVHQLASPTNHHIHFTVVCTPPEYWEAFERQLRTTKDLTFISLAVVSEHAVTLGLQLLRVQVAQLPYSVLAYIKSMALPLPLQRDAADIVEPVRTEVRRALAQFPLPPKLPYSYVIY